MPSFPHAREGTAVKRTGYPVHFVLYARSRANAGTNRMLASDPWKCIELHLLEQPKTAPTACSFLHQAYDFFHAAGSAGPIPRPVLMYYAFLNLAKAIILHRKPKRDLRRALHGIVESRHNVRQRFTLTSQEVVIMPAQPGRVAVLNELGHTLGYPRFRTNSSWNVCDLLAQIPAIHRAYSHTRGVTEHFFPISKVNFMNDHQTRRTWALLRTRRFEFSTGKVRDRLVSRRYFKCKLVEPRREQLESDENPNDFYYFQSEAARYGHSPFESLPVVCRQLRDSGVVAILTPAGYRYYVSDFEPRLRVPPLLAAYMAVFYFGFVARYRPLDLEKLRKGKFAWVIEELLATQGEQFAYLAASELLEREVIKPLAIQQRGPLT